MSGRADLSVPSQDHVFSLSGPASGPRVVCEVYNYSHHIVMLSLVCLNFLLCNASIIEGEGADVAEVEGRRNFTLLDSQIRAQLETSAGDDSSRQHPPSEFI
jgi:hypothetical protein